MKKALFCTALILFIIVLFTNKVHGSDSVLDVSCDGKYIEGSIYTSGKTDWDEKVDQIYRYHLSEPGKVNIHVISHIKEIITVKVKDSDENILQKETFTESSSPIDMQLTQREGDYDIYISHFYDTSGDYRFKIDYTPIKVSSDTITVGKTYNGYFPNLENSYDASQTEELWLEAGGEYDVILKTDTNVECKFKNEDEDTLQTIYANGDEPFKEKVELPKGKIIVEFSGNPGTFELTVDCEGKTVEEQTDVKKSDSNDNQSKDKVSFIDKLLSPSSFIGGVVIGVLACVIGGIILHAMHIK